MMGLGKGNSHTKWPMFGIYVRFLGCMERYSKLLHKYMDQLITGATLGREKSPIDPITGMAFEWDGPTEIGRGKWGTWVQEFHRLIPTVGWL